MQKIVQKILLIGSLALITQKLFSQNDLPVGFSPEELQLMQSPGYKAPDYFGSGIATPPPGPLRTMAQWEEEQALTITWISYKPVLLEIVKAAALETKVYIICGSQCPTTGGGSDSITVKNYLSSGGAPASSLLNVHYIYAPCNSVWTRDYSANSVYMNDVDSLVMVDWKYNRPTRTSDDTVSHMLARRLRVPLYETQGANQLIHTGGNFMSDGLGTAFSSKLGLNENTSLTEAQINTIMQNFMGITRYPKMDVLPYDGIHHIDMHMKLLNEETLLIGQYPSGTADGPQIEANLQYILSGFNSVFGTPYKVIRIPQPPDQLNGYTYPNNGGNYLTYTNSSIINKTVIVPQYYTQYDTTALRIFRDAMPGYNIVGINSNSTISASGSLHCITHSVGVTNPLLIVHQNLPNTNDTTMYRQVNARIQCKGGIYSATVYYTNDTTLGFTSVAMNNIGGNVWRGDIPAYPAGTHVFYYIKAHANSGKEQVRPMPAPRGTFMYWVLGTLTGINDNTNLLITMKPAFPNPSHGITCIPVSFSKNTKGTIKLYDMIGKEVTIIYEGEMPAGEKNFVINSLTISPGAYLISVETSEGRITQKLMIR